MNEVAVRDKSIPRVVKCVIGGPSGAGKTTLTTRLGKRFGYLALQVDKLRYIALKEKPEIAEAIFQETARDDETGEQFTARKYYETKNGVLDVDVLAERDYSFFDKTNPSVDEYLAEIGNNMDIDYLADNNKFKTSVLWQPSENKGGYFAEGIFTDGSAHLRRPTTDMIGFVEPDEALWEIKLHARLLKEGVPPELVPVVIEARRLSFRKLKENTKTPGLPLFNGYDDPVDKDGHSIGDGPSIRRNTNALDYVVRTFVLSERERARLEGEKKGITLGN